MSEVRIVYSSLEDAVDYASKARTKIDNYITQIGNVINTSISNLKPCIWTFVNIWHLELRLPLFKKIYYW